MTKAKSEAIHTVISTSDQTARRLTSLPAGVFRAMQRVVTNGTRVGASLAVVAGALMVPSAPALADDAPKKPVAARLEFEIKSVHVYSDREPWYESEAEVKLVARVWKMKKLDGCPRWTSDPDCIQELTSSTIKFSAETGQTVTINRTIPEYMTVAPDEESERNGPGIGIPFYADEVYGWQFDAVDEDPIEDDQMGWLNGEISQASNWGTPGEYTERGTVVCGDIDVGGFCAKGYAGTPYNPPDGTPAYYNVNYVLRLVPLPNLTAQSFKYDPVRDALCMGIMNNGTKPSGPFEVLVAAPAEGAFPGKEQTLNQESLAPNSNIEPCIAPGIPSGDHAISFTIDPMQKLTEVSETDNRYQSRFQFAQAGNPQPIAPNQTGNPTGTGQADLIVTAVRVKGDQGTTTSDCDPGKNDVIVTVKNQGATDADKFDVSLEVDGDKEKDKTVNGLDAGKSQDVTFNNVQLKKGERKLMANADSESEVTESQETNNELKATVNCKDEN